MSLADSFRKKKPRPAAGADPARAFGSEELTMEEIQRQNFVPPREKLPGLAQRAGSALSSLRQKIVGEEPVEEAFPGYREPEPAPRNEAPVYSARTYQNEAAPELGWENPFTNPAPGKKEPMRSASPRASRAPRSYPEYGTYPEAPANPADPYGVQGRRPYYAPDPYYSAPVQNSVPSRTEGYGSPAQNAPSAGSVRGQEYYPPEGYGYTPAYNAYTPDGYAPQQGYAPAGYDPNIPPVTDPYGYSSYGYDTNGYAPSDPGYEEEWTGGRSRTTVRRKAPQKPEAGDFKYMFWSGSIVVGVLLTLTAFIYGCSI